MVFLNFWVLFGLIPLFLLYKKQIKAQNKRQIHLLYLTLLLMFIAMARPAIKNSFVDEKFNSQDYIIAIDASFSMQATDLYPSRYIMAKKAIKKLILQHPKDRFTIFAFTSNTLLISPPTTDTRISMQALNALNPNYILTKGTNLYNLFTTISKISFNKKNLIIFSDGGEENNIGKLANVAKKNNIILYIVATASQKGAALQKDGHYLKNSKEMLIISRINPILRELALLSSGKYYELSSLNIVNTLSNDIITRAKSKHEKIKVKSYKELFYVPIILALFFYFISVTKLHQLYIFLPLLLFPYKANADLLDFYHLQIANQHFKEKKYLRAAQEFKKLEPSVQSYYNIASSYYKAKSYKSALQYYSQIRTHNLNLKQAILYNMGNCASQLKKYAIAKRFYVKVLALREDEDALYNLLLLQKLYIKPQKSLTQLVPKKKTQKEKNKSQQKNNHKKKKDGGSNNSNQSNQSTNGQSSSKTTKKENSSKKSAKKQNNYKIGYKAYEIINKGYTDEKSPW